MPRSRSSSSHSNDGSPRRRLELDDDGSQSVPLAGAASGPVRYDSCDHTLRLPRGPGHSAHMMALPRALLRRTGESANGHGTPAQQKPHQIEQRSPSAAATAGASPVSVAVTAAPRGCAIALCDGCAFVRLPHPRHGEAALFLCPPPSPSSSLAAEDGQEAQSVVLYEVQAQKPPGGFGQTWFVNSTVEPNEDILVVTPFDVTFFALGQAATHAMRDKFVSAEDLIMGARRSDRRGGPQWPGWGVALAQCPALAPAVAAMQSNEVLARVCDAKCVGGDHYYRYSEVRMAAWLQEKMQRVSSCPAMHSLLQLKPKDGDASAPIAVPRSMSFAVVAEYVTEEVSARAAQLCSAGDSEE